MEVCSVVSPGSSLEGCSVTSEGPRNGCLVLSLRGPWKVCSVVSPGSSPKGCFVTSEGPRNGFCPSVVSPGSSPKGCSVTSGARGMCV